MISGKSCLAKRRPNGLSWQLQVADAASMRLLRFIEERIEYPSVVGR